MKTVKSGNGRETEEGMKRLKEEMIKRNNEELEKREVSRNWRVRKDRLIMEWVCGRLIHRDRKMKKYCFRENVCMYICTVIDGRVDKQLDKEIRRQERKGGRDGAQNRKIKEEIRKF